MNSKIIEILKDLDVEVCYQIYTGNESKYITFFKYNGQNESYSDDNEDIVGHYYQIDIWSKQDYTDLEINIKSKLKEANFKFVDEADLYESDTKIYHKALRYVFFEFKGE